jgi:DNA sulfur modification protein DndD
MALQLRKVYLRNWKCYTEQEINLSPKSNQNIFIFYGRNGAGKTSLQEGILWCLYGKDIVSLAKLSQYFNRVNLKIDPDLELVVKLTLADSNNIYEIQRVAQRMRRGSTFYVDGQSLNFYMNGQLQVDGEQRIESLLPRSCREFFFFDGKKIEEYAKLTHTDETRKAIERTLGIPEIKNLRDDAEGALKKFEEKIKDAAKNKQQLQIVTTELATIKQQISAKKGQAQKIKEELKQERNILEDIESRASQIAELENKQKEIEKEERKKRDREVELKDLQARIDRIIQLSPIYLLSNLLEETADDIQSKTVTTTRISVSVDLLRELISEKICLCGRCVDNDAHFYLQQQIDDYERASQNSLETIELHETYSGLRNISNYQTPNLEELLEQKNTLIENIEESEQVINRHQKETAGFDSKQAQDIWENIGVSKNNIKTQGERIQRIEKEIEDLRQKENQLKRKREELSSQDKSTTSLNRQLKIAEGLQSATEELIGWFIDNRRETIEKHTTNIHRQVTNKPDEYLAVKVKPDYTLGIENINSDIISPEEISAGEKEALSFAFISGLNLASDTSAPLMMDTPFGHLDNTHQKNIVKSLPQIPSQVILLATDRDLPEFLLQELKPYVAQILQVRRLGGNEDASVIEVEE